MTGKKPIRVFAAGGVRAAIWENEIEKNGQQLTTHAVQVVRTYKDGDEFKSTSRFGLGDLPRVQLVAAKAFEFLSLRDANNGSAKSE